jgi:hypothetical protein
MHLERPQLWMATCQPRQQRHRGHIRRHAASRAEVDATVDWQPPASDASHITRRFKSHDTPQCHSPTAAARSGRQPLVSRSDGAASQPAAVSTDNTVTTTSQQCARRHTLRSDAPDRRLDRQSASARQSSVPCGMRARDLSRRPAIKDGEDARTATDAVQNRRATVVEQMPAQLHVTRRTLVRSDRASLPASVASHRATSRRPWAHASRRAVQSSWSHRINQNNRG